MSYADIIFSRFDFVLLQIVLQEAEIMNQGYYHVDQDLYILSSAIGKVLFERKPLGELFVKPKRQMKDSDDGQLPYGKISLDSSD